MPSTLPDDARRSALAARFTVLAQLPDGWLDGDGRALDSSSLRSLAQGFSERLLVTLPLPYLYPTPESGVQAEWSHLDWEVSLTITLPCLTAAYQAVHIPSGDCQNRELSLADRLGWVALNAALAKIFAVG